MGVDYAHVAEESFDESGAMGASLAVDERANDIFTAYAGLRLGATLYKNRYITAWLEWANGVWRPELHARWRTTLAGADRDLEARFRGAGGARMDVEAEDAESGVQVGIRSSFQPQGYGVHLDAGVDAFLGDGNLEARAHAAVRIPY